MDRRWYLWLVLLGWVLGQPQPTLASNPPPPARPLQGGWETIPLEGATCGTGAPYQYFLSAAPTENKPLLIYMEGGGGCIKEGLAPAGATGAARQLYCMNYSLFPTPTLSERLVQFYGIMQRNLGDNTFRDYNLAFVPYCTGDLHAGTATSAYDYNPDETETFGVTHRGHLNVLAVLDDLSGRFTDTTAVVLTGSSAGGLGALYNFPEVIERWPNTTLVTDAGTLPDLEASLLRREWQRTDRALPWQPQSILPPYCDTIDCFLDTTKLLQAYAAQYDGSPAPWRPFGMLQGSQDQTMRAYMEVSTCAYQAGLREAVGEIGQPNLRAFIPATQLHTFLGAPPDFRVAGLSNYRHDIDGVTAMQWTTQVISATGESELPTTRIEAWGPCAFLHLPILLFGQP